MGPWSPRALPLSACRAAYSPPVVRDDAVRMFAGPPQPVEIHHGGIWYSGELIGWRHESNGRVSARVRCRVDGLRHSAWTDLADLRLPDPRRPPHKEPYRAVVRGPVPSGGQGEEDATQPHALLAALRSARPATPAHAAQPPARHVAGPTPGQEPTPVHRRNRDLTGVDAYLAAQAEVSLNVVASGFSGRM